MSQLPDTPINVLFVCLGNICRSPTAHGIFQDLVEQSGVAELVTVDSAGTGDWHVGRSPDLRAQQAASSRGYDLSTLRARVVTPEDFRRFHYVLAMDGDNLANLKAIQPSNYPGTLSLFLDFAERDDFLEVPDPYYGGDEGFELVLDLVEEASRGLLKQIQIDHFSSYGSHQ